MNKTIDDNRNDDIQAGQLLQRYFDGTLTEAESRELSEIWDRSEHLQNEAVLEGRIESALRLFGASQLDPFRETAFSSVSVPNMDELVRLAAESPALPVVFKQSAANVPVKHPLKAFDRKQAASKTSFWILAPLCLGLLGLLIYFEWTPSEQGGYTTPRFLGTVTACVDARFEDQKPIFQVGQGLTVEKIALKTGLLEIRLKNGVRFVLEGPGELDVKSVMNLFCREGRLSVFVPAVAKGFEVATPHLSVRDLGTEFVLDVRENEAELHVVKGEVEANWLTKDWFPFVEGYGVRLAPSEMSTMNARRLSADPSLFSGESKILEMVRVSEREQASVLEDRLNRYRRDGAILAMLDGKGDIGMERVAGDRTATGCLPGRNALVLKGERDHAVISVSNPPGSLTLLATVRLDEFGRVGTFLLSERFYRDSGILWQLDRNGSLQFHHRSGENIRMYDTGPVIGPEKVGAWLQLALVVDAETKTVSHYVNGRRVAQFSWAPQSLEIGRAALGNELPGRRKTTRRFWEGSIDHIVVFGRPLRQDEIQSE